MFQESLQNFPKQFKYQPKIENQEKLESFRKFVFAGMGGSGLAGGLLKIARPDIDIITHRNYGLPPTRDLQQRLVIVNSYSGNTEEALSAFQEAQEKDLPLLAISTGGRLIELAQKYQLPYIQMPLTGIQPRLSLGFNLRALLKVLGDEPALQETAGLASSLKPEQLESLGKTLAQKLKGFVPIIYASNKNKTLAYLWKIHFNESGKIPAFFNTFPELNHNEMQGFERPDSSKSLSEKFSFIFLKDSQDHPQIQKRMAVTKKLFEDRGLPVEAMELSGNSPWERIFNSLLAAAWTACWTAELYGTEPEQVPLIEEFKSLI
jgi:glucose/mannose-6-phosphate isomerase